MSKIKKNKIIEIPLMKVLKKSFEAVGYKVEADSFSDGSGSWLTISKEENPNIQLELSFNDDGSEFTDFNVWEIIMDIVGTNKII